MTDVVIVNGLVSVTGVVIVKGLVSLTVVVIVKGLVAVTGAVKVNVLLTEKMMELEKRLLTGKIVLIGPVSDIIVLTELGLLTVIGK